MQRNTINKLSLSIHIIIFCCGLLGISFAANFPEHRVISPISFSIGSSLIATSVFSFVFSWLNLDVYSALDRVLSFKQHAYDKGLEKVFLNRLELNPIQDLNKAVSVDMMYNTALSSIKEFHEAIYEAILLHGCKVRILISDPDNIIWETPKLSDGLCFGTDVRGEIKDVIKILDTIVERLENKTPMIKGGSLELRHYSCLPTNSLLIIDRKKIRHTPYLPHSHSSTVPIYEIVNNRGNLFDIYQETFNNLWKKSELKSVINFHTKNRQRLGHC